MPTGRPDYWYGTALYFDDSPGDGEVTRGPTCNWAYDHVNDAEAHHAAVGGGDIDHGDITNVTAAQHHAKYTDADAVDAMGAKGDGNPLHHDIYLDADAVSAMGAKGDGNPLHHDIYLDADAVGAMGAKVDANPLHHDIYSPRDQAELLYGIDLVAAGNRNLVFYAEGNTNISAYVSRQSGANGDYYVKNVGTGDFYWFNGVNVRLKLFAGGGLNFCWDDTPTNGQIYKGVTSDWAFDHTANHTAHGATFVDRGDAAAYDWIETDLTRDAAWHDLDMSPPVPAGALAVLLRVRMSAVLPGNYIGFRKKGDTNGFNESWCYVQANGISIGYDVILTVDGSENIQYFTTANATSIDMVVGGWWI